MTTKTTTANTANQEVAHEAQINRFRARMASDPRDARAYIAKAEALEASIR